MAVWFFSYIENLSNRSKVLTRTLTRRLVGFSWSFHYKEMYFKPQKSRIYAYDKRQLIWARPLFCHVQYNVRVLASPDYYPHNTTTTEEKHLQNFHFVINDNLYRWKDNIIFKMYLCNPLYVSSLKAFHTILKSITRPFFILFRVFY